MLGRFEGHRLYAFALTHAFSRMRYIEFTRAPRQDIETLLSCAHGKSSPTFCLSSQPVDYSRDDQNQVW
jgi:hypothetical protein